MKDLAVIILAAGKSKRMKTRMPKVLHKVGGKCLIDRVLDAVEKIEPSSVHMVVGYEKEQIIKHIEDTDRKVVFSEQKELLGTGHAVAQAIPNLKDEKYIMVINGDMPLVNAEELENFYNEHISSSVKVSLMSAIVPWESDFGRIIRDENKNVIGIKEFKDSTDEEKKIKEVNLALYIFEKDFFVNALPSIGTNNAQKEYYLTDLISIASKDGEKILSHICADPNISRGVNSREDLAEIESFVRESKVKELMKSGVTFIDPKSAFIDSDVEIGMDTVIYPFTIIEGKTVIGENCVIGPSSRIVNSVVGDGSTVANSILLEAKTGKRTLKSSMDLVRYSLFNIFMKSSKVPSTKPSFLASDNKSTFNLFLQFPMKWCQLLNLDFCNSSVGKNIEQEEILSTLFLNSYLSSAFSNKRLCFNAFSKELSVETIYTS